MKRSGKRSRPAAKRRAWFGRTSPAVISALAALVPWIDRRGVMRRRRGAVRSKGMSP